MTPLHPRSPYSALRVVFQPFIRSCNIISQWLQVRLCSPSVGSPWFFPSRNDTHITRQRFWQIIRAYGVMAGLAIRVHPHMLHHACGVALAERGNDTRLIQDYLRHKNIRHSVRYTTTSPARFRQSWRHLPCHTLNPENTSPEHDSDTTSAHLLPTFFCYIFR
ncbi:tyrosine-type recombinase/integrase [Escherichia coli]|uniref:tyrosine-type recombinase/integrase n=1 Tax=Escherichia coli TaxID=562 RepID=UPI001FCF16E3|nr:tyrosine-type recombinase/integrase [Escherichia coli]